MNTSLLIVDDSLVIREKIKAVATRMGLSIVGEAKNGDEAIVKCKSLNPGIITLDIVMPGKNGIEVLQDIREWNPKTAVLMLSAIDQSVLVDRAKMLGASGFVVKPFSDDELSSALKSVTIPSCSDESFAKVV